jgi:uncharacterized lipoprotein NlpE involved in copper resistance
MKKIFVLTLCISIAALSFSCGNSSKKNQPDGKTTESANIATPVDMHNAQNSLDYQGKYHGILPTASGEGMDICIMLEDGTYTKEVLYIGKSDEPIVTTGSFSWNETGNTITLIEEEKPNQYFVSENMLVQLDINGNKIESELADNYILKKE